MTLQRVLEAEVMDTFEEAEDYDRMDHSSVNRVFVDDLTQAVSLDEKDVLDLGTGTAQIPVVLCEREATCRVMAVDLSVNMLELARYNLELAGLVERITLNHIDAKELPFDEAYFDGVMSNSIIHHIPTPAVAIAEAWRVLRPGGWVFFRDLLRPRDDKTVRSLVQQYAGDENEHQQQMFEDSLRAALTLDEMGELVQGLKMDNCSLEATTDRHWTWIAHKPKLS